MSLPSKIDLHCHLMAGVDDGPRTLKDSLLLARALVDSGFNHVVATPHYIEDYSRGYRRRVEEAHIHLTQSLQAEGIPLTVCLGGELMLLPGLADKAKERALPTLNGTRYILLELPLYQPLPLYAEEVLFALQARGYIPILAHPERMEAYKGGVDKLFSLTRKGILLQVNLGSLAGLYGPSVKGLARKLLRYGLAAFLATDSHDAGLLDLVARELKEPSPHQALLGKNPQIALRDEEVVVSPQQPPRSLAARVREILKG